MSIANQIKSLTEDIEVSYGTRTAAVSDIVKDTHRTLGDFNREHEKMAADLKRFLAADSSGRVSEVRNLRTENTKQLKETAKNLLSFLSSGKSERKEEVAELLKEIKGFIQGVEEESEKRADKVKGLLKSFGEAHQERTALVKRELSSFQKNLSSVVEDMRTANSSDHKLARAHWQNLAKVMAAKRAGKSIPKPLAEMGVPVAVKEKAEEAFEKGELREKVLKVIQANPGGIRLVNVGKALGVAFVQVAKPIKDLLAEVKITKRNDEYVPS